MPTLNESASHIVHNANLDAYLYNEKDNEAIFCEMKMAEWMFNSQGKLKEAYLNQQNYYNQDAAAVFKKIANVLSNNIERGILKRYDVWQMYKHTLACFNGIKDGPHTKRITLLNVV